MVTSTTNESENSRAEEVKAFDDTRTGVKGLVDSGLRKVPRIFLRPSTDLDHKSNPDSSHFQVPVIDLHGINEVKNLRKKIVDEIRSASEKWGFFQVVNHGVPLSLLDEMIKGVIRFHEQDDKVKKQYYGRDRLRRVEFSSNFDLYQSKAANWRDTLTFLMNTHDPIDPGEMPVACRDVTLGYAEQVTALGGTLFELLSESLGLNTDHLKQMQCGKECVLVSHYYPACPEPELTLGSSKHTDPTFLTILLQDQIGGLQVLHEDHWVDVTPNPGALIINIGDFLQITSNDKLKSIEHRVLANRVGPRISVACFLNASSDIEGKTIGPIKELISADVGPVYRNITTKDYFGHFFVQGLQGVSGLDSFKM